MISRWLVLSGFRPLPTFHYSNVIMGAIASQITSLPSVHLTVDSGADQRKYQSSASLAFVREIHRWPVNSPHKGPVTRKMFPFDDVIIRKAFLHQYGLDSTCTCKLSLGYLALMHNNPGSSILFAILTSSLRTEQDEMCFPKCSLELTPNSDNHASRRAADEVLVSRLTTGVKRPLVPVGGKISFSMTHFGLDLNINELG